MVKIIHTDRKVHRCSVCLRVGHRRTNCEWAIMIGKKNLPFMDTAKQANRILASIGLGKPLPEEVDLPSLFNPLCLNLNTGRKVSSYQQLEDVIRFIINEPFSGFDTVSPWLQKVHDNNFLVELLQRCNAMLRKKKCLLPMVYENIFDSMLDVKKGRSFSLYFEQPVEGGCDAVKQMMSEVAPVESVEFYTNKEYPEYVVVFLSKSTVWEILSILEPSLISVAAWDTTSSHVESLRTIHSTLRAGFSTFLDTL